MGFLLSDDQMRQYVINGVVQVESTLPAEVHESAHENTRMAFRGAASAEDDGRLNPGNNILPMVPELHEVVNDPAVVGALTSLFGPNYLIHPHRHCHPNFPVAGELPRTTTMGIHKDGHADGNPKPRHRVPRWGLLFYNPHPCPDELGPTCISPQSHLYHRITSHGERERNVTVTRSNGHYGLPDNYVSRTFVPVVGNLGTVSILHFDMVHSVITNVANMPRYAHKFVVMRTEEPNGPSWDGGTADWDSTQASASAPVHPAQGSNHEPAWRFLWDWLRDAKEPPSVNPSQSIDHLLPMLQANDHAARLQAVNELALHGDNASPAIPALIACLKDAHDGVRLSACYTLGAIGNSAIGALVEAARADDAFYHRQPILNVSDAIHGLVAVGSAARGVLLDELARGSESMRAWAAFALGELGNADEETITALVTATRDAAPAVAKHAITALGIAGRGSERAESSLRTLLSDEDRDKRVYAVQGLIRLDASAQKTIAALGSALTDPHPYVAAFAHELLYRNGGAAAQQQLLSYLRPLRWFPYPSQRGAS